MKSIKIDNITINKESLPFIIAEIGANFEHSIDKACEMIEAAAKCGVSAVKFQTYNPKTNVTKRAPKFWDIEGTGSTQYEEQIDGLILDKAQYKILKQVAEKNKMIFFSSVCDIEGVELLEEVGVPAFKLSSMEITNLPFLKYMGEKGKPVILSTGASDLEEVREAVDTFLATGNKQLVLLHCVSNYPTIIENVNLNKITTLIREFPALLIGYSDHTLPDISRQVITAAVALGARVIEKHFTFDSARLGFDHEISADYLLMDEIVKDIEITAQALGDNRIKHLPSEEKVRLYGRRGAVSRVFIPKGTKVTEDMIIIKRPAMGIQPKEIHELFGKITLQDIPEDEVITWDMIKIK